MPTARSIAGSAVVDGKIYVIGGAPVDHGITAAVEEYNPATDTWIRRADMPTARQGVVAAAVDGIIYAIGGWGAGSELPIVEAYDPATDTWTTKTDMPTARSCSAAAMVDGKIYVIGGYGAADRGLSTVEAYEPATDTWTKKADMPTARCLIGAAACVVDGRIYVSGGCTENVFLPPTLPTVEVYDPVTDTWTQTSDMPMARWGHSASVVAGKIYIVGGVNSAMIKLFDLEEGGESDELEELFSIVDVYDPATETWTRAPDLPTPKYRHTANVVDGKIYTIGGSYGGPNPLYWGNLSMVDEFDPGLPGAISSVSPAGKLLKTWGEIKKTQ
jgi:N-acetylneuraminic acid mutarotase